MRLPLKYKDIKELLDNKMYLKLANISEEEAYKMKQILPFLDLSIFSDIEEIRANAIILHEFLIGDYFEPRGDTGDTEE